MTTERRELGARGERAALRFLRRKAMRLRMRNWRSRSGEVDLVMEERGTIIFVEVRTRTGEAPAHPLETLTKAKGRRLVRVAEEYLYRYKLLDRPWRIDCVFITLNGKRAVGFEHIENAV